MSTMPRGLCLDLWTQSAMQVKLELNQLAAVLWIMLYRHQVQMSGQAEFMKAQVQAILHYLLQNGTLLWQ